MSAVDTRSVIAAFTEAFYRRKAVREAFDQWVAPGYVQHNAMYPDGREAAVAALEGLISVSPALSFDVKRILIDGELAAVHAHVRTAEDDPGLAVVDIFRVEDGRIAEHWDVVQPVPAESRNGNTMF